MESSIRGKLIVDPREFEDFCTHIAECGTVAFDSEFVSEHTYRPELCLLQFATHDRIVGVDPFQVQDLSSWWNLMADPAVTVIVHGGQAEIRFCLEQSGQAPASLIDVQLAEGFRGRSYPLSYDSLVARVLGKHNSGKETRTDWRRRPLTDKQVEYALADVAYLSSIWDVQRIDLVERGRLDWVTTEVDRMIDDLVAERDRPTWHRLGGIHRLRPRELSAAIELSDWREREAKAQNRPIRRILRDDLIIDLARRQPQTLQELAATRDMNRTEYKKRFGDLIDCLARARQRPLDELPQAPVPERSESNSDEHVLGQLLGIALASRCAEQEIARPLVGTSADLRHLLRWHLYGEQSGTRPRLAQGWRADLCGDLLADVMDGKISMRVADPNSDHPLVFERLG